jgi:DNA-binding transcriptional ArsR family regulator
MKAHERYNMNLTSFQFVCQASVTGAPQQVLTALLSHCYSKGECFPSVKRLAIIAGVSVRTIHRALNCLKELGIITIIHRFNKEGKKCSNLYILNGLQERLDQSGTKENRQGICHGGIYKSSSERAKKTYDTNSEQKDSGFALQNEYEILEISDSKKSKAKQPTAEAPKAKENAAEAQKTKQTAVRFEGSLDKDKVLSIFDFYTSHGFLNRCMSDLMDFLACCSYLNRECEKDKKRPIHRKKIKNRYGLLTFLTKTKQLTKPIKWEDDEKARRAIVEFRNRGLIDF